MRMWARFEKGREIRHISHLDLHRAMGRALRRAGFPIAYSAGFNPHALLSFASALPVGMYGTAEILDVGLTEAVAPVDFVSGMNVALPEGIRVRAARLVEDTFPSGMALVHAAEYVATLNGPQEDIAACMDAIPALLTRESIPAMKKTKKGLREIDIRPLILSMDARRAENEIGLRALHKEGAAVKPGIVIGALAAQAGVKEPWTVFGCTGLLSEEGRDVFEWSGGL